MKIVISSNPPEFKIPGQVVNRPVDVIALGSLLMERIVQIDGWPMPGGQDTIPIQKVTDTAGGCAMNVACFIGRMGGRAAVLSPIGDGDYAKTARKELIRSRVDLSYLIEYPQKVGSMIMILTNPDGGWAALDYVDTELRIRMIDLPNVKKFSNSKVLHVDGFSFLTVSDEDVVLEAVRRAKQAGCLVSVDASVPAAKKKPAFLKRLFQEANILFANQFEAMAVSGANSLEEAVQGLREMQREVCVVKAGIDGSYIFTQTETGFVLTYQVEVVDTVAAGDAYVAATLLGLCRGMPLMQAAKRGSAAGGLACLGHGSLSSFFTDAEIDQLIRRGFKHNG